MKLKNKLIIAFFSFVFIPVILLTGLFASFGRNRIKDIEKAYGVDFSIGYFVNSVQAISDATQAQMEQMKTDAESNPDLFEDYTYLDKQNKQLQEKMSYLIVVKDGHVTYQGTDAQIDYLLKNLPEDTEVKTETFIVPATEGVEDTALSGDATADETGDSHVAGNAGSANAELSGGTYIGGEVKALVKHFPITFSDQDKGNAYIVAPASALLPQIRELITQVIVSMVAVLTITAAVMSYAIYQSIANPLKKLQIATRRITGGDYDFKLESGENDDEISNLTRDFEAMRKKLAEAEDDKTRYDKENRELIRNISHDLKTPITTVKGYCEGIMDGVANTPEKIDRYIKTIYNKANDMERLINELTFYSKIDTNRIPYTFNKLNVAEYFDDCAEELQMDMEDRGIRFTYENLVDRSTVIIADAEQLKRVINNIVSNSVKYIDKPKGHIDLRIHDAGDFIQVEIEDNGKGISAKDLPNIFDRSFRTDAARNSAKGGSGIGLSIVKKIIEDHSGKIWAGSELGHGTTMYFVIRKYQVSVQQEEV